MGHYNELSFFWAQDTQKIICFEPMIGKCLNELPQIKTLININFIIQRHTLL